MTEKEKCPTCQFAISENEEIIPVCVVCGLPYEGAVQSEELKVETP
jgi:hypothetical protein